MTAALRLVRQPVPDRIVCPDWCQETTERHREELADPVMGGEVQHTRIVPLPDHRRADLRRAPRELWLACSTYADGTTYDGHPSAPEVLLPGEYDLTLDEAEEVGRALLEAARVARAEMSTS